MQHVQLVNIAGVPISLEKKRSDSAFFCWKFSEPCTAFLMLSEPKRALTEFGASDLAKEAFSGPISFFQLYRASAETISRPVETSLWRNVALSALFLAPAIERKREAWLGPKRDILSLEMMKPLLYIRSMIFPVCMYTSGLINANVVSFPLANSLRVKVSP